MRIAMMTNNYKPFIGGVPISIDRLSRALRSLGHEVYIFAPSYEEQEPEKDVIRYKTLKHKLHGNEMVIPNIIDTSIEERFKELKIDLIHVHHPMLIGWTALYLGKKYKIPVTYTYHTRYERYVHYLSPFNKLEELCLLKEGKVKNKLSRATLYLVKNKLIPLGTEIFANCCDTVFAPSKSMEEYLIENKVSSNIEILPTGLSENYFYEDTEKVNKIRRTYLKNKKFLFCTVSRLSKEKNIEFIIEGLKKLKEKVGDSFNTLIIGNGPLKEELKKRVNDYGMDSSVEFLSSIPNEEIGNYYRACDMFLFASTSETQGIVLIEAMAAGNPVVAVRGSGVVEVLKDGVNGYITDFDEDQWVERIIEVVGNEKEYRKLKEGAYETGREYSEESIGRRAEHFYKEVIRKYCRAEGRGCSKNIPATESYK